MEFLSNYGLIILLVLLLNLLARLIARFSTIKSK